jgi:hypothetical protein
MTEIFNLEVNNLIVIYDISNREYLISQITAEMPDYDDDVKEVAETALKILKNMSDSEFADIIFTPEYGGDDDGGNG